AYQHGLLADLPPGISAPRCLAITEQLGERVWLWLEDLTETEKQAEAGAWPLDRYRLAARHLGAFNGAYAAGRLLPAVPWLSPEPLQSWVTVVVTRIMEHLDARALWQHPLMRTALPGEAAERLRALWTDRRLLLAAHGRPPRAFSHMDAFRANLVARCTSAGQDETVAIDWAWAGIGALGEELGPLVVATVLDGALPVEALPELESVALEGYLAGLADAGWYGDPRLVWLGYAASAPLRYAFLLAADVARAAFDESFRIAQEARHGVSTETVARGRGAVIAFLLDRADEVCALAS
ncbi:MAG: aminoglycoside phosphotransferase, partial [Dehalococcoidia bacterium]